ncbi:hypothetical protein [Streptomyces sp. NPDC056670]|uniref:hypothetical protein n=1 Tax=Streptomyces sp. NPDC056670 TaxID=3345904 RepID=UPI0036B02390
MHKVIDEWAQSGIPVNVGDEWTRRLNRIAAGPTSKGIPLADRRRLAAFPETVVLTELVLDPPAHSLEPKDLYMATTAELGRRLSQIYTTIGTQDPSTGTSACRLIHGLDQCLNPIKPWNHRAAG